MTTSDQTRLQSRAVRGGLAMAAGQISKTVIQFASLVVLARMLAPTDFGLVAMATAVVGITSVISDFGLSMSIVRTPSLSRSVRDQIFYVNVGVAIGVASAVLLAAPLVASLYGEPRLESVTRWLALTALLSGIAPQYRAELARAHRFRELATVDGLSQLGGLVAAVVAAANGAGYWTVVLQQGTAAGFLMLILIAMTRYVPITRPGFRGIGPHLIFGASALAVQSTNYIAVNAAPIAVGRLIGAASAGLYSRSFQLISFPLVQLAAPLTRVVVPLLAQVETTDQLVRAARRIQMALACTLLPLVVFLLVGGEPLVVVLFGDPWRPAGTLTQILAIGGIYQTLGYVNYWLFVHIGRLGTLWLLETGVWVAIVPLYFAFGHLGAPIIAAVYAVGLLLNWLVVGTIGLRILHLPVAEFMVPSLRRLGVVILVATCGISGRQWAVACEVSPFWTVVASSLAALVPLPLLACSARFRRELLCFSDVMLSVVRR